MTMTLNGSGTGTVGVPNSATAQNSTSGTAIDFTGIPAGIKRITVMFNGVSTNGSSNYVIQIGSGSPTTSGYNNYGSNFGSASGTGAAYTNGFNFKTPGATNTNSGSLIITNVTGNTWTAMGMIGDSVTATGFFTSGGVALSGVLDRVRITTANGTDTFDAGSINILYE